MDLLAPVAYRSVAGRRLCACPRWRTSMAQVEKNRVAAHRLALVATIDIKAGEKDRVLRALLAHRDRCLRDEPGTVHFDVLMPRDDDSKLLSYEVYENDAAFDTHLHSSSIALFRKETDGIIGKINATRCTPAA